MKEVAPGEGAGWFCLGDARTAYDEMVRSAELGGAERVCSAVDGGDVEVCRMSNDADLTFQASFLTKIRVHGGRRARDGRYYRSDVYEVPPYTHFSASEDNIKRWLPGPAKRSTILDPDFGQLILLEYDGLTLELERADGGAVLTGIVVQRKGT